MYAINLVQPWVTINHAIVQRSSLDFIEIPKLFQSYLVCLPNHVSSSPESMDSLFICQQEKTLNLDLEIVLFSGSD